MRLFTPAIFGVLLLFPEGLKRHSMAQPVISEETLEASKKQAPILAVKEPGATRAALAGKDQPFVNSLGMKFVPVKGTAVLFSIWETRVQDYAAYASSAKGVDGSWKDPLYEGVPITPGPTHPVVNVSWNDARKFCAWLTEKERRSGLLSPKMEYRLPSDAEWSWAVGIGDREGPGFPRDKDEKLAGVYPWGAEWPPPKGAGNFSDQAAKRAFRTFKGIEGYDDGFATTSPAGSFAPNDSGIFDLSGNVSEWCEDTYEPGESPRARQYGWDYIRVVRGGFWNMDMARGFLSSRRGSGFADRGAINVGFRCVLAGAVAAP